MWRPSGALGPSLTGRSGIRRHSDPVIGCLSLRLARERSQMSPVPDGGTPAAVQPHQVLPGCRSLHYGACAVPASTAGVLDVGPLTRCEGLEVVGYLVVPRSCVVSRAGHGPFTFPQQPRPLLAHFIERRLLWDAKVPEPSSKDRDQACAGSIARQMLHFEPPREPVGEGDIGVAVQLKQVCHHLLEWVLRGWGGRWVSAGLKGACVSHTAHWRLFCSTSGSIPGQYTDCLALRSMESLPWCPACKFARTVRLRAAGTTSRGCFSS
ncbi:hypothetical protein E2C01_050947 [Portunus trituberculatus]|uniref:Uncharacterized protein n=1 Tax=Portunus trituberculatus TaxID=210409 RepID=A0A5B7GHG4_PORTR|nr:hypothetical protein [Portunus trituberculatus]